MHTLTIGLVIGFVYGIFALALGSALGKMLKAGGSTARDVPALRSRARTLSWKDRV